jgi:hypothetical protein
MIADDRSAVDVIGNSEICNEREHPGYERAHRHLHQLQLG